MRIQHSKLFQRSPKTFSFTLMNINQMWVKNLTCQLSLRLEKITLFQQEVESDSLLICTHSQPNRIWNLLLCVLIAKNHLISLGNFMTILWDYLRQKKYIILEVQEVYSYFVSAVVASDAGIKGERQDLNKKLQLK